MKFAFPALFVTLLFISNTSQCQKLTGHYKVSPASFSDKVKYFFKGVTSYVVGSEIHLYNDSTYKYLTCGNIMTGYWKRVEDEVWLTTRTNRYRIDSLNNTRPKLSLGSKPTILFVSENTLTQILGTGKNKSAEILTKVN